MAWRPDDLDPLVIVMMGKPARGKTFTARRLARYLTWLGYRARVFNVGAYRRDALGAGQPASFFDPDDAEAVRAREAVARRALDDLLAWVREGGEVALLDATHGTRARRDLVRAACDGAGVRVLFVSLVADDPAVIASNVRETKVRGPDYVGRSPDEAFVDFMQRIAAYDRAWEPLRAEEGDQITVIDGGRRIEAQGIHGQLAGRLATYLLHLHHGRRCIYLTRHGQSLYNLAGRIGGDAPLAPAGEAYAARLAAWMREEVADVDTLPVWTSTLRRTQQTAAPLGVGVRAWKLLDEIDAGVCDGLTYAEVAAHHPAVDAGRRADKFGFRYPQGESYEDVIDRLDPVVLELERQRGPVLIVAHQAVLRALHGYLTGLHPQRIPHTPIPLHTVMRVTPDAYGTGDEPVALGPEPEG